MEEIIAQGDYESLVQIIHDIPEHIYIKKNPLNYLCKLPSCADQRIKDNRVFDCLIKCPGININTCDNDEHTPLMNICSHHRDFTNYDILERLTSHPMINIDAQDNYGLTALMLSIPYNNLNTISILLKNGAKTSIKNKIGHTAIDIARNNDQTDVLHLFRRIELAYALYPQRQKMGSAFSIFSNDIIRLMLGTLTGEK